MLKELHGSFGLIAALAVAAAQQDASGSLLPVRISASAGGKPETFRVTAVLCGDRPFAQAAHPTSCGLLCFYLGDTISDHTMM